MIILKTERSNRVKIVEHKKIWESLSSNIHASDIISAFHNPSSFQLELASIIDEICVVHNYTKVIEVGCEKGITNMLLNKNLEKHFLDYDNNMIIKVKQACEHLKIKGTFLSENMFSINCPNGFYDVLFNSGVIEHFNKKERIEILREYSRVLNNSGMMILAVPNHHSFPYRCAYLLKKRLLGGFQWPWPKEFKIFDLEEELKSVGLQLVKRFTLGKETIFHFWGFFRPIRKLLLWSDMLFHFEGYLTTLLIRKT
jgi:2-polyprenyl-3-methyl-5-hydroxy-6-metoxy-1,4-benzoquinol methylase